MPPLPFFNPIFDLKIFFGKFYVLKLLRKYFDEWNQKFEDVFEEIFRFFRLKLESFFRQQAVVIFRAQEFRYRQYLKKNV